MKKSTNVKSNTIPRWLTLGGIFGTFLCLGLINAFFFVPIIGSHAESGETEASTTTAVGATLHDIISVNLNTSTLSFDIVPTADGVFESKPVVATVTTNSTGGYELYFSSEDNATNMVHDDTSITAVIASDFSGTVTGTTMAKNKWGYSTDNTNFSAIPTLSNHVTLTNITHLPTTDADKQTTTHIGVKVAHNLQFGTYRKTVVFSAIAHQTPTGPFGGISDMQEMTNELATAASVGDTATLTDTRDNETYVVTKLADNKVWMTQNLRLNGARTLHATDSDVASDWSMPAASWGASYDVAKYYVTGNSTYGTYYNYAAASAGDVTGSSNTTEAAHSICPKGWRMPTQAEYAALFSAYSIGNNATGSEIARSDPLNFVYSGYISYSASSPSGQGSRGSWWSSTATNATHRYNAYIHASNAGPAYGDDRQRGLSLRCVAR